MQNAFRGRAAGVVGLLAVVAAVAAPVAGQAPRAAGGGGDAVAERLFVRHCAVCHGAEGRADAAAVSWMRPRPRDFGTGLFQLVSTENGVPTHEDLVQVLRRGMPGSAMPSFAWLAPDDLDRLARHVRTLAVDGLTAEFLRTVDPDGTALDAAAARASARRSMQPGALVAAVEPAEATLKNLDRGRALFGEHCAACHGPEGRGRPVPDRAASPTSWPGEAFSWARDFTRGPLKGGADPESLTRRVVGGMPGTGMPPTRLSDADTSALLLHVTRLLSTAARAAAPAPPQELVATRVDRLPDPFDASAWPAAAAVSVELSPFVWSDEAVKRATFAALHDGAELAIQVRWPDATRDEFARDGSTRPDGVALQFSDAEAPPLLGMGSDEQPVTLWHWRSFAASDAAGIDDLLANAPHGTMTTDVPRFRVAKMTHDSARELTARGAGDTAEAPESAIRVEASYERGEHVVVFRRALEPGGADPLRLEPGASVRLACAVWNGSAGDRGGRKSISTWNTLTIAP